MRIFVITVVLLISLAAAAQQPPKPDVQEFATQHFGATFTAVRSFPLMTGDLNGDGVEDAVMVATSKSPLQGEEEYSYRVIDPYNSYFGWGDPKITVQFSAHDPRPPIFLLIVHSWREATPKAKYVVMNIPFEKVSVVAGKKRDAVMLLDEASIPSALHWDGRKYKWSPGK